MFPIPVSRISGWKMVTMLQPHIWLVCRICQMRDRISYSISP